MTGSRRLVVATVAAVVVAGHLLPAHGAEDTAAVVVRRITLPVEGRVSYSDDFGDPRSGDRTHEGIDMLVPKLTPLLAAADARVRRMTIDDGTNSGNMLTLRDAQGWSYTYIHINNDTPGTDDGANPLEHAFAPGIEVGASVTAGQVVAFAGDSGNAEGTSSHLHFEIRRPDGTPINPFPSLRIAQGFRYGNYCAFDTNPPRDPGPDSVAGYWLLGADGGVFSFGEAPFHGSTGDQTLNRPAVAMAAVPDGSGYWFAASDGGVFAFGDAAFFGSTGDVTLNEPIVGMASTPTGEGYWLVASDGGIFTFGDAEFLGSTGDVALNQPIAGLAPTPSGEGYWLLARDGGIFTFGDAGYFGSLPGGGLCTTESPAARLMASATGDGYWVATADGAVTPFGDAVDLGSRLSLGVPPGAAVLDLVMIAPTTTTTTTTTMRPTTTTTKPKPSTTTTTTRRRRR
ncbi:MAG: M23 family metallopeptidase [Acidimicrobiia bacterium]